MTDQPSPPLPSRLHARVKGRVQGVGFRYYVLEAAQKLGVRGWVRNRWDGSVETVAEADKAVLNDFLGELRKGPRAASVSDILLDWQTGTGEFFGFEIRRTE
jgi:acylphosphatase